MYQPPGASTSSNLSDPPSVASLHTDESGVQNTTVLPSYHFNPSPRLYWPQEYIAVAVVVVYIGTAKIKDRMERIPMVARVSMVDYHGNPILDTYVHPTHPIEDYRTEETGLQYTHLIKAPHFQDIQFQISNIIKDKVLVGHSLWQFLSVLGLSHPAIRTRDLALFRPLRKKLKSRFIVSLPTLINLFMGRNLGLEYENPLEMARASMDLFRSCDSVFEEIIVNGAWPCDLPPSTYAEYFT